MRKADNLPPSCAVVTKFRKLNFLESSGPLQACNATALPSFVKLAVKWLTVIIKLRNGLRYNIRINTNLQ